MNKRILRAALVVLALATGSVESVKNVRNNLKVGPPTARSGAAQVPPP